MTKNELKFICDDPRVREIYTLLRNFYFDEELSEENVHDWYNLNKIGEAMEIIGKILD